MEAIDIYAMTSEPKNKHKEMYLGDAYDVHSTLFWPTYPHDILRSVLLKDIEDNAKQ